MTPRAPEVRYVCGYGTDVAAARRWRIGVHEDGTLRAERPGRPTKIFAATEVRAAMWLDRDQTARLLRTAPLSSYGLFVRVNRPFGLLHQMTGGAPLTTGGAVVLAGAEGPLLSWLVDETAPWAGDAEERRTTSGTTALVRALGLTLEPATDPIPDLAAVRRSLTRPESMPLRLQAVALVSVLAAIVLAVYALRALDEPTALTTVAGAAGVLALLPALAILVRGRRAFLALATAAPDPGDRRVHRPRNGRHAHLQLGPDDVVVVDGAGGESWLPGPARGGVAKAVVGDREIHLVDPEEHLLHVLATDDVVPDDDAAAGFAVACAEAGIELVDRQWFPLAAANEPVRLRHREVPLRLSGWRVGDLGLVASTLLWLALALLAPGVLAGLGYGAMGWPVLVGYLVSLGVAVASWVALRRWRRDVARREAA